jgi:cobalt-precorrin-5B (C1)-methyltransferase
VQKDGGDDPDVTGGLLIYAEVSMVRRKGVNIRGGEGVGTVTKPGLQVPVGWSAINPVPRSMIRGELENLLDCHGCHRGVSVTISIPGGEEIAARTFNPKLGIEGGISIIGTTGIVKPYSVSAVKKSLVLFLDQACAHGITMPVLVPGNVGERAAHRRYALRTEQVAQMSNFVGYMVRQAAKRFHRVLVLGHPGKLLKVLLDCYNTHSQKSASPLPMVREKAAAQFWFPPIAEQLVISPTVEGVISCIPPEHRFGFFNPMATGIERRLRGYARGPLDVGVVLVNMEGHCVGSGPRARRWEEDGCLRLR